VSLVDAEPNPQFFEGGSRADLSLGREKKSVGRTSSIVEGSWNDPGLISGMGKRIRREDGGPEEAKNSADQEGSEARPYLTASGDWEMFWAEVRDTEGIIPD